MKCQSFYFQNLILILSLILLPFLFFMSYDDTEILSQINDFRDLESIQSELQQLAKNRSDRLVYKQLSKTGTTIEMPWVIISNTPNQKGTHPKIFVNGAIHGNESLSAGVSLALIHWLASDSIEAKKLREQFEFHIIPVVNVNGFKKVKRRNGNNVDLNRNFPWAWEKKENGSTGFCAGDQIETQILMDFCQAHKFTLVINGHTGESNITGLWDYIGTTKSEGEPSNYTKKIFKSKYLPAYNLIHSIGATYAKTLKTAPLNKRIDLTKFYYTEGFDWYPVYGSFSDWLYTSVGSMAFTLEYTEMQDDERPTKKDLQYLWIVHKEALIELLKTAGCGLHGTVVSVNGNQPVEAKIEVKPIFATGRGADPVPYKSFCFSNSDTGDFHLMLSAGRYQYELFVNKVLKKMGEFNVPMKEPLELRLD